MGLIEFIKDAFGSTTTGSNSTLDKRTSYGLLDSNLSPQSAIQLWKNSDVAQRIIDSPVDECFREGWELQVPDDHSLAQSLSAHLQDLNYESALRQALRASRVCGGAVIYMHTQDADLTQPLKPGSKVVNLLVFSAGVEIISTQNYVSSLDSPAFGQPASYSVMALGGLPTTGLQNIHRSRLIIFNQPIIDRTSRMNNYGFGPSILGNLQAPIRDFEIAYSEAAGTIPSFSQPVIKLQGLNSGLAAAGDPTQAAAIKARLQALNNGTSMYKAVILDAGQPGMPGDEFTRVGQPLTGLSDVLEKTAQRLSMACRIPIPILMGEAPAGLNATGDSSIRAYYDYVSGLQTNFIEPAITQLVQAILGDQEPESWGIEFTPLWSPSDLEVSTTRKNQADSDQIYFSMGALSAEEIRTSRFGGDEYSSVTTISADSTPDPQKAL